MCGYSDAPASKLATAIMNEYVDPATGKVVCCVNSTEDKLPNGFIKKSVFDKMPKASPVAPSAPVTPVVETPAKAAK